MRKITMESINAFNNNVSFKKANMQVKVNDNEVGLYLHGNLIACKVNNSLYVSNGGWSSNTTKERLNALHGVSVQQKNWIWYLNGIEWDGSLTKID